MGAVADACLKEGGKVIGVMPRALVEKEIAHRGFRVRVFRGADVVSIRIAPQSLCASQHQRLARPDEANLFEVLRTWIDQ
jgi:hypothetical protein